MHWRCWALSGLLVACLFSANTESVRALLVGIFRWGYAISHKDYVIYLTCGQSGAQEARDTRQGVYKRGCLWAADVW